MDPADFHQTVPAPKIIPVDDPDNPLTKSPTRSTFSSAQHATPTASYGSPSSPTERKSSSSHRRVSSVTSNIDRPLPKVPTNDDEFASAADSSSPVAPAMPNKLDQPINLGSAISGDGNPFGVDLVIPFDVSLRGAARNEALYDAQAGYTRLIQALQSVGGLRIASRPGRAAGKGNEEIWVFVGASDAKVHELVEEEK